MSRVYHNIDVLFSQDEMPTLIGRHLYIKSKSCSCTGRQRHHKLTAVSCGLLMLSNLLHSRRVQLGLTIFNWWAHPLDCGIYGCIQEIFYLSKILSIDGLYIRVLCVHIVIGMLLVYSLCRLTIVFI